MRKQLATFVEPHYGRDRLGLVVGGWVVDASLAYASLLSRRGVPQPADRAELELPPDMLRFLQGGEPAWAALSAVYAELPAPEAVGALKGARGESIAFALDGLRLRAPVPRPGKIIHTAGNFREHAKEGSEGKWGFQIPPWISFLKCTSSIIGHEDNIVYPRLTRKLDHEIEVGIVIGRGGRYIPAEKAWDHIAGFTVFNDISARDIQAREMKSGLLNLGKNLDTFAPFGPVMTLRDDIGDVHQLKIELRVNGDPRQVSSTSRLAVSIPEIVSHWSVMRLEPGDIISTGTVSGVAAFRPDPGPYWLKPGDVVECEIENIGLLRNRLVADELTPEQEAWLARRESLFATDQVDEYLQRSK
jgi:2-keto-4-pentenoate hydratase/2-oxohepta-3-ene-1,7-dioic acid hydratase in catechol pathway